MDDVLRQLERCESLLRQCRNLILERRGRTPTGEPTAAGIRRAVAAAFEVSEDALRGPGKCRDLVRARLAAAYLMRRLCSLSWPQVGLALCRDHSTLLKLSRGFEALRRDPQFDRRMRYLLVHFGVRLSPSSSAAATLERELADAGYRPQTARTIAGRTM